MKTVSNRKVNKPRLTLRKKVSDERFLHPMYRGIVPFLLYFGAPPKLFGVLTPEAILGIFASYMNKAGGNEYGFDKINRGLFKAYLKKHSIEDWTKDGQKTLTATLRDVGVRTGKGKH